jgi:antibiotic biosynthesis monooxygenase (ABM) superfamily enzyme
MTTPSAPKKWKFALLVWCFIYPVITILSMTVLPYLTILPPPLRTLVMSLILVPLMAYFYIPYINKRFYAWLRK